MQCSIQISLNSIYQISFYDNILHRYIIDPLYGRCTTWTVNDDVIVLMTLSPQGTQENKCSKTFVSDQ